MVDGEKSVDPRADPRLNRARPQLLHPVINDLLQINGNGRKPRQTTFQFPVLVRTETRKRLPDIL